MEKLEELVPHSTVTFIWFAGHGGFVDNKKADGGTTKNAIEFLHAIDAILQRGKHMVLQKLHALAKVGWVNEPPL